ncbi:MAG TPA: GyrI-like domain-containing protein [Marmoricola sp.]|jgi:effector-binding domain-containing protein
MGYRVEVVHEQARHLAVVRFRATPAELPGKISRAFGTVGAYLTRERLPPAGPPVTRYELRDGEFEVATGFPVSAPVVGDGIVLPLDLPECDCVRTVHVGRYEDLGRAYDALRAAALESGRSVDEEAPMWEEYLTGPDVPADRQRTVVHWPLARVG